LREIRKWHNLTGDSVQRVHEIQKWGMEVWGGLMLGLDHDDHSVFAAQRNLVTRARIMHAQVSMISAIPRTPFHARLAAEDRVDRGRRGVFGTNVIPRQLSREELREGFVRLMLELYEPEAYFARYEDLYLRRDFTLGEAQDRHWREHRWAGLKSRARLWMICTALYGRLVCGVREDKLRRIYCRQTARLLRFRRDPRYLLVLLVKCAAHYHYWTMARQMAAGRLPVLNPF
jgi:hypothetical protein